MNDPKLIAKLSKTVSHGCLTGLLGGSWEPLGTIGCPWVLLGGPGVILIPIWGGFSGDVSFSLGHRFFYENTGIVLKVLGVFSRSFWSGLGPKISPMEGNGNTETNALLTGK